CASQSSCWCSWQLESLRNKTQKLRLVSADQCQLAQMVIRVVRRFADGSGGVAVHIIDSKKLRFAMRNFGWAKTIFLICLLMLLQHAITFAESMALLLLALLYELSDHLKSNNRRSSNLVFVLPLCRRKKLKASRLRLST